MDISNEALTAIILAVLAMIGSLTAGMIAFFGGRSAVKKTDIEALDRIIDALQERVSLQDQRIKNQDERIFNLEAINADLEDWAERLCCQIKELGQVPVKLIRHKVSATNQKTKPRRE